MTEMWNDAALRIGDRVLGGLFNWGQDAVLAGLILLSSGLLILTRWMTIDARQLAAIRQDEKTLRALMRGARREGDASRLARYRTIRLRVARLRLREELRAGLLILLPLALLLTWASERLAWRVPYPGEPIQLQLTLPAVWEGEVVHLVPLDACQPVDGWVQVARRARRAAPTAQAIAAWQLECAGAPQQFELVIRFRHQSLVHPWRTGAYALLPATKTHDDNILTSIQLAPYRPLGIVPDLRRWGLPAWLVAYLPLTMLLARALRTTRILRDA